MDMTGKVVIEPSYERYQIPNQKKEEILLVDGNVVTKINGKGEVLEGTLIVKENKSSVSKTLVKKRKCLLFKRKNKPRFL
jgi:hypothetical protein